MESEPDALLPNWKIVGSFGTRAVSAGMIYVLQPASR
jgi:hypothetical protein